MVVNRHKYFRWTKRTAFLTTMYVVVVPATLGYFGYITDVSGPSGSMEIFTENETMADDRQGKWDFRGKRRGDTISEF